MAAPVGLLEAFELSESCGDKALTIDELLFMADCRKKKGCKLHRGTLTNEDKRLAMELGLKCKAWKEGN